MQLNIEMYAATLVMCFPLCCCPGKIVLGKLHIRLFTLSHSHTYLVCSRNVVLRSSWHAGYRRVCHLAGISHHENIVPAVHCARHCGGYLVATLILSSLNPRSRMETAPSALQKVRLCIHTQETPRGEVFPGGWEGGGLSCVRDLSCVWAVIKAQSSKPFHSATNNLFHVVQGCLVLTLLRYC